MRLGSSGAGRDPTDTTYHWWENTKADQDHVAVPVPYRWRIAGTIVGAVVVVFLVTFVLIEDDSEPIEYRSFVPTAIETDGGNGPVVTDVEVEVVDAEPTEGRVRVRGEDLVRVDVAGDALCEPVSGANGAWIDIRLCGALGVLTVTAHDVDDATTSVVARF